MGGTVKAAVVFVIVVVATEGIHYVPCIALYHYIMFAYKFSFLEGIPIFSDFGLLLTTIYFHAGLWHLK